MSDDVIFGLKNWMYRQCQKVLFCRLCCMTWLTVITSRKAYVENVPTLIRKTWYWHFARGSIHGNTTSIWSQHAWKCVPLGVLESDLWWGLWQMTSCPFGGDVRQCWGWPKGFTFLPPTSVCPQLLGEPWCTCGGIPDTTLTQQGTKQEQPHSWSCLVKKQAGQWSSSQTLIPLVLWDCRARLYSQLKLEHMLHAWGITLQSSTMSEQRLGQVFSWAQQHSSICGRIKYDAVMTMPFLSHSFMVEDIYPTQTMWCGCLAQMYRSCEHLGVTSLSRWQSRPHFLLDMGVMDMMTLWSQTQFWTSIFDAAAVEYLKVQCLAQEHLDFHYVCIIYQGSSEHLAYDMILMHKCA